MDNIKLSQYVCDAFDVYESFENELQRRKDKRPLTVNLIWTTKKGIEIPISKMSVKHIHNTMNLIIRTYERYNEEQQYNDWFWKD